MTGATQGPRSADRASSQGGDAATVAPALLAVRGVSRGFPGVQALADVDIDVGAGEVVGLVGENGAGKSTLIKVLAGALAPDAGALTWDGQQVEAGDPLRMQRLGIAVIHQELNLADDLDVAENIFIGHEPRTRLGMVDRAEARRRSAELLARLDLGDVDPATPVGALNHSRKQLVEIARALSVDARLIVMDEPTASLASHEAAVLLGLVQRLRDRGVAVLYVSHRLEEVFAVADRLAVLRDGRLVATRATGDTDPGEVVRLMVGRPVSDLYGRRSAPVEDAVALSVVGLRRPGSPHGVDFDVRRGEIVGFAGLVGAGRTETVRALFGVDPMAAGEVTVAGRQVRIGCARDAIAAGLAYVPEDRKLQGLFLGLAVRDNVASASLHSLCTAGFVRPRSERRLVDRFVAALGVRLRSTEQPAQSLSGGNQQKVVISRWLATAPKILILDEPTRGVDVGAKAELYGLIRRMARDGLAIVLISSELGEVIGMCDRVVVFRDGAVVGECDGGTQEHHVMALATGVDTGAAPPEAPPAVPPSAVPPSAEPPSAEQAQRGGRA